MSKTAIFCICLATTAANYNDKLPEHEQAWVHVCKNHCHLDGSSDIHNSLKVNCDGYRYVLPRPRVHTRCRSGFIDGMELACHNYCVQGGHSRSSAESQGHQFCKQYKGELPKPGAHEACRKGHAAGALAAHQFAMKKHAEYKALVASVKTATEEQVETIMEKEAEIEEELAHNTEEDVVITKAEIMAAEDVMVKEAEATNDETTHDLEVAREAANAVVDALEADEGEEISDSNTTEIDL